MSVFMVLFHIAAPYPGSPLFFEVVEQGWFRSDARWEQVDMDCSTVLDYPHLRAEELERWARRAFRSWALRPGPVLFADASGLSFSLASCPGDWPGEPGLGGGGIGRRRPNWS